MEVPQLQSPSQSDRNNDEEYYPSFLDFGNIKPLRHRWTDPQREVLCVLRRFYSLAKKDETKIFNHIFDTEIVGFKDGLPVTTVNTQHYDMLYRRHLIWVSVNSASLADDEEYEECRRVIEIAATELGIHLHRRNRDDSPVKPKGPGFQLLQSFFRPSTDGSLQSNPTPDADTYATHEVVEPAIEPAIEPARARGAEFPRAGMKPRYDRTRTRPQILYRFFNSQSSGINDPQYFSSGLADTLHPSLYHQRDIEAMAKTHLSRYEVNSPFISTFSTLLPCVHRMLTKGQNSRVSIIDASKLDQNGIFSAQYILSKEPLSSDITPGYYGWSEWLIWREIPESSIVCTITQSELLEIAELHHDIGSILQIKDIASFTYNRNPLHCKLRDSPTKFNNAAGVTVGKFLRIINLPVEYANQVAVKIAHGWRFTRETRYAQDDEFLDGVQLGYSNSTSASAIPFTTPPITPQKSERKQEIIVIDDDTDAEVNDQHVQEVVVIEDDEDVEVEDVDAMELDELVVIEDEEESHHHEHQINQAEEALDRFREELRRTIESESEVAEEVTQRAETTYRWQSVEVELGGNEAVANVFALDRERVNRMMGW
ncbi:hypothetical protein, variant [Blastomyces dermatitidis ATCC 18188]|uniref:DUF7587 domain-containing protein n=1 Tax=Ajellomyces dermatitidis (strain ATCC 18188 / CBS 674.68) TaxID=653446 RepID=F2TNX4_AJEDA|nr:hypothetical protein BDDG_07882 [Blastomyces dermatitidis ATCC 18188]KMW68481.1 hypothetical protein, variant [Blastomyces dermatitidis ATCC 18188]